MTVQEICEELTGKTKPSEVIAAASPLFFDFDYPFFDDTKKDKFQQDFIRYFYTREIGQETVTRFFLRLQSKLNTIMPAYNKMLEADAVKIEWMYNNDLEDTTHREHDDSRTNNDVDSTTDEHSNTQTVTDTDKSTTDTTNNGSTVVDNTVQHTGKDDVTNNGTSTDSNDSHAQTSDLPQSQLADFNDNSYLSSANKSHSTASSTSENTSVTNTTGSDKTDGTTTVTDTGKVTVDNTRKGDTVGSTSGSIERNSNRNEHASGSEDVKHTIKGAQGDKSALLKSYYESIKNITQMIYDDCDELFMQLWEFPCDMVNPLSY